MFKIKSKDSKLTFAIMGLVLILISYFLLALQITNNYLPVWNDEFFYYTNAASFFENTTLKAALTYNGSGSKLLGADAHGFAYPLLNGSIAKLFGWHNLNFIYTNFFFVAVGLMLVFFQKKITSENSFFIALFVLLFPFFAIYGFTYMQESVHIFFAIVCSILIGKINREGQEKDYCYFILVVFIAALFRPFWLLWLVGLIPFAVNAFKRRLFILLFLFGGVLSVLLMYYFSEFVPNYFASVTALIGKGDLGAFFYSMIKHFTYNGYAYFFKNENSIVYFFVKCSILAVLIFFSAKAYLRKSKLFISIAFTGVVNFLVLFFLYDVFMWRETRILVPFFYFCIPFLVFEINSKLKLLLLFILVVFFVLNLPESKKVIAERNMHTKKAALNAKNAFKAIAPNLSDNAIVFINYYPSDSTLDLINVPVKNISNNPVRYIVPYYRVNQRQYNYILNLPGTKPMGTVLISNQYFQLEKIK
jgi:hypothetical protein